MTLRWPLLLSVCAALACDAQVDLTVEVQSDLAPGREFVAVRTSYATTAIGEAPSPLERTLDANVRDDFIGGTTVAVFDRLESGDAHVRAALLDAAGGVVAERDGFVSLSENRTIRLVITRDCRSVSCPGPSDPAEHTTCAAGRCIPPRCVDLERDQCPTECDSNAMCLVQQSCAEAICVGGQCLAASVHERCAEREYCDVELGCQVDNTPVDATVDAPTDARDDTTGDACSATETACGDGRDNDCDGQSDCDDPDCANLACDDGDACTTMDRCGDMGCEGTAMDCDDSNPCTDDSCSGGVCTNENNTASCDDGDACTENDTCSGGSCGGSPRTCNDSNPCTDDSCNPGSGCIHTPRAEHSTCGTDRRCCGGSCVNIRTDPNHCSGCGQACAPGFPCVIHQNRPTCDCTANSQCNGGTGQVCSPTYDLTCACTSSAGCVGPQTCIDVAGARNYCTY